MIVNESHFFKTSELTCHCGCGKALMVKSFMDKLDSIRMSFAMPLRLSSAYRCPEHNKSVSATGDSGPHTTGRAVDVIISGREAFLLMDISITLGMTGIGVKQHGPHTGRYLHLDDLETEGRPWVWSYP
jgi:uncharacterized protein YcbK (DUF882 family)